MATKFGLTWWGQRWLDALTGIDHSNRLPRGASYARGGRVLDCKIEGNCVTAKVAGHYASSYRVKLTLPAISQDKVQALATELRKRPALLSKLLNRELSPDVSELANKLGIQLFPQRWKDLGMSCNCPDGAVPCKHVAAVIYILCQELDNNPFLIFTLHGVDLLAVLSEQDDTIAPHELPTPDSFSELLKKNLLKKGNEPPPPEGESTLRVAIDYSGLPDLTPILPSVLQDSPPFYAHGDFREEYEKNLTRIRVTAERMLSDSDILERMLPAPKQLGKHSNYQLRLHEDLRIDCIPIAEEGDAPIAPKIEFSDLVADVLALPPQTLAQCQSSIVALRQCAACALQLLAHGAILPHIVKLSKPEESFAIHWLPALLDNKIANTLAELADKMPPEPILFGTNGRRYTRMGHPAAWMVSLMATHILSKISVPRTDFVSRLFFAADHFRFDDAGEQEIPGGIKAWTDRLFLEKSRFTPVFIVDETLEKGEFRVSLGVVDKETDASRTIGLSEFLSSNEFESVRVPALRSFAQLTQLVDGLDEMLSDKNAPPLRLEGDRLINFLLQTVPAIRLLQAQIMLPRSLKDLVRPKATISLKKRSSKSEGKLRIDDLLDFDWRVAIGEETISVKEFNELTKTAKGLLYYKGRYIYLTAEDIQKLKRTLTNPVSLTSAQLLQTALTEELGDTRITLSKEVRDLIKDFTKQEDIPLPQGLNATLRPYQERGYSWLYRNMRIGFGSILADDMGLGKTIQLISLLLKLKEEGAFEDKKALIIAPTGLLTNWQAELERFAPSLKHHLYHGPDRTLENVSAEIILTSYGVARLDVEKLNRLTWEIVTIDEAQNIKNLNTAQSKAVRSLPATTHVALSGTPVENRLSEFWSIMDFANKGYLGSSQIFDREYAQPIQATGDKQLAERFRKITAPFMMRRLKSDKSIISDLPDKLELNRYAQLTPSQASLYHETLKSAMEDIEEIEGEDNKSLFKREGLILQLILALKQICNHPGQFLKNKDADPTHSGKAMMLLDLIESIVESGEKVLIFTQFREMGELLQQFLEKRLGESPMFYHGGCSIKQRNEFIHRFQTNPAEQILILSLKAAGTGLNLTAASHVIHYDLWWNPAVENQATDRAYRIGQTKNVVVHRFITKNTFEEKINAMIYEKKALANLTVTSGESWIGKLSNAELRELFG